MSACLATPVSLLTLDIEQTSTEIIVRCTGQLISDTCALLQDTIQSLISEGKCIVLDLCKLSTIDNPGLGVLAGLWAYARKRSANLGICWQEPHPERSSSRLTLDFRNRLRNLFRPRPALEQVKPLAWEENKKKGWLLLFVLLVFCAAGTVRLWAQTPSSQSMVEMKGVKPSLKLQTPLEGFMTALNGKLDLRASEVEFTPGGEVRDHYHFGPGIRRVMDGELTLVYPDTNKEQVVRAGDYFYESGDVNIWAVNRGSQTARLLIVELVPRDWKSSAMAPLARRSELEASGARLTEAICSK
ncbi:MAG TPA: cupin domain-containing protein [Terriglobales bacterium]|nr:cupin domain-containing protein [Terriglobales bacterium]